MANRCLSRALIAFALLANFVVNCSSIFAAPWRDLCESARVSGEFPDIRVINGDSPYSSPHEYFFGPGRRRTHGMANLGERKNS
jgi:hypothetical protein